MKYTAQRLYELLPAIYRIRDAESGEPLKALLSVIAEQVGILEENLDQLYDDQFIETCAEWVVPYIGDLIGCRTLYGAAPTVRSARSEVANTIRYRRRKGTATMLEQMAHDVTGWDARVVEFFELLISTQYMNHRRPRNLVSPDLRRWEPLERVNTAFDTLAHTVDVRSIARGGGKFNIKNIGIFLWRLVAYSLHNATPFKVDAQRYLFNPLGINTQLFTNADPEEDITHLATRTNVPAPTSRRTLAEYLSDYYGEEDGKSLCIYVNGKAETHVRVCNLADISPTAWAHLPANPNDEIAIDPVLGRIAFPPGMQGTDTVEVTYHYGFSADMGGGEYLRDHPVDPAIQHIEAVSKGQSLQNALDLVRGGGAVEITDNATYDQLCAIHVDATKHVELRAEYTPEQRRPVLTLSAELLINGDDSSEVTLDGLLIDGKGIRVPLHLDDDANKGKNALRKLTLRHCTLVPGLSLALDGGPSSPLSPSVVVEPSGVTVAIDHCIVGGLRSCSESSVGVTDSIVDATGETMVAYASDTNVNAEGGALSVERSTVIGKIHAVELPLVSNTIILANLSAGDLWAAPVIAKKRQTGCVRFSFLPHNSQVPRRFKCQPDPATETIELRVHPVFNTLRYGLEDYCQLRDGTSNAILSGADDEAEMGAFHDLYRPQRETNLHTRLDEYLRFGLEAGIFYAT